MTLLLPRSEVVDVAGRIDRLRDTKAHDSNGPQDTRTPSHEAPPSRLRWSHVEYARKDAAAVGAEPAATSANRRTFTLDDVRRIRSETPGGRSSSSTRWSLG